MRLRAGLGSIASVLLVIVPAAAQSTSDPLPQQSPSAVQEPGGTPPWREGSPLLAIVEDLELSPAQAQAIERLGADFARESIRREAERQIDNTIEIVRAIRNIRSEKNVEAEIKTQAAVGGIQAGKPVPTAESLIDRSLFRDAGALIKK